MKFFIFIFILSYTCCFWISGGNLNVGMLDAGVTEEADEELFSQVTQTKDPHTEVTVCAWCHWVSGSGDTSYITSEINQKLT